MSHENDKEYIFNIVKNRIKELEEKIKSEETPKEIKFGLRIRWHECYKILYSIGYEEPEESLDELFEEWK